MEQVGRNVTDCEEGPLKNKRYLIRNPNWTPIPFRRVLNNLIGSSISHASATPFEFLHHTRSRARERKTTWKEFLSRHFDQIAATDFFSVEVWTTKGLQRFLVLFFIELSSRRVQLAGIARCPNGFWM